MRKILILAALLSATPALAGEKIFDCKLGTKRATVTVERGRVIYRYGSGNLAELTIAGSGATGNVHGYVGRYAEILRQVRFTKGEYSYILYTMGASRRADSSAVGGLTVMRGTKVLSNRACKPWVEFTGGYQALDGLPQDDDSWSAMAL